MDKIQTENEINIKITNKLSKSVLIDEDCCTLLTISLTNEGNIFTSFLGAYNEDIIKLLKRTQKTYYKGLLKKLRNHNAEQSASDENAKTEAAEPQPSEHSKSSNAKSQAKQKQPKADKTSEPAPKTSKTKKAANKANNQ